MRGTAIKTKNSTVDGGIDKPHEKGKFDLIIQRDYWLTYVIMQGIIITAYKDTKQLMTLLDTIYGEFKIFLHIDAKSNELDEKIIRNKYPSAYVIKKYRICWGGVNHLKAILELLSVAIQDKELTYFHIISGQDLPVKDKKAFHAKFDGSDKIYMNCMSEENFSDIEKERVRYWILSANLDCRYGIGRKLNMISRKLQDIFRLQRASLGGVNSIYKGLVWVSMPINAAAYADRYIQEHPEFMADLEHTMVPEEFFFQTIFMNSKYRESVVFDSLRYFDWSYRNGDIPAYLDESDYCKIAESNDYFARKIDSSISKRLVTKLNRILN